MDNDVEQDAETGQELRQVHEEAHGALERLLASLNDLGERVEAFDAEAEEITQEPIDEAREALQQAHEKLEMARNEFTQADEHALDTLGSTTSTLAEATATTVAQADSTIEALDERAQDLASAAEQVESALAAALDSIAREYDVHAQSMQAAQSQLSGSLRKAYVDQLDAGNEQAAAAIQEFNASAERVMAQLVEILVQALGGLTAAVQQAIDHAQNERAPAQLALDAVEVVVDPLIEQVERLTSIAETLGVSI